VAGCKNYRAQLFILQLSTFNRQTVLLYVRYPLSLRQVEDLLFERGIDICYETARISGVKSLHESQIFIVISDKFALD